MKNYFFLMFYLSISSQILFSQFSIGHTTFTFNDPLRTGGFGSGGGPGRQIQSEIYYPAATAGTDVAVALGEFPVIVFGHGFAMTWEAYENIWEQYVPLGYVIVFPRTESGLFPSPVHVDFGEDLVIVEQKMQAFNSEVASLFYQKLKPNSAIMGHSMGGGCTILAGENNTSIKTVIGFAPAETTPSAISASTNNTVPALIFSGAQDGVTPPASHHLPIYDALGSACKTYISITGGAHCYFANSNFNCDFGESTSSTGISITRAQQQQITYDYLTPWLDFYLNGNCDAFTTFENLLALGTGITSQRTCNYTPMVLSSLTTDIVSGSDGSIDLSVSGGEGAYDFSWSNSATTEDITNLPEGSYTILVTDNYCTATDTYLILGPASTIENTFSSINVFPNPTDGILTLNFSDSFAAPSTLQLVDALGQIVLIKSIGNYSGKLELDLSGLSPGIYFMNVNVSESTVQRICVVIE